MKKALILVDIQNDFCPGGSLAVNQGDEIIPVVNELLYKFDLIVATQDWHPEDHISFASNHPGKNIGEFIKLKGGDQILWPNHCVRGSKGADFVAGLNTEKITKVFQKGTDKMVDSYSGFYDNDHENSTGLGEYLKEQEVDKVFIAGLATDYCVKYTALDALKSGFDTTLIEDASRGVEINKGDVSLAVREMKEAGTKVISSSDVT